MKVGLLSIDALVDACCSARRKLGCAWLKAKAGLAALSHRCKLQRASLRRPLSLLFLWCAVSLQQPHSLSCQDRTHRFSQQVAWIPQ